MVSALAAAAPAVADSPSIFANTPSSITGKRSYLGLTFDLGMPDVIGVAITARPLPWLHVQAGGSTCIFTGGVGGAVSFIPLKYLLSPSFTLAGGHVFSADTNGVPAAFGIKIDGERIGYDYASAHFGIDFGARQRVHLSLQAGASFLEMSADPDGTRPTNFNHATLHVWTPSGRLAVTVFL